MRLARNGLHVKLIQGDNALAWDSDLTVERRERSTAEINFAYFFFDDIAGR